MKVSCQEVGDRRRVDIMGTQWEANELDRLIIEAALPQSGRSDFYFYDAPTVPAVLVEQFTNALKANRLPKLWVFHEFLRYQFNRMNLPCYKVDSRRFIKEPMAVEALVLAGSAGSLDKLVAVVRDLPRSETCSVFIVQHVGENQENLLDQILQTSTDWEVHMPQNLEKIRPSVIYVAPPARNMRVSNGYIYLTQDAKLNYARPSIEALIESAGLEYNGRLIVTLFCGEGSDGVGALKGLRQKGAMVIVEDVRECEFKALLLAAQSSGQVDMVLPVAAISSFVAAAFRPEVLVPDRVLLSLFLESIKSIYGYDFSGYRDQTIYRRLERLTSEQGYQSFFQLQDEVLRYPSRFESFFLEFSVKVTHFFRDPSQLRYILEHMSGYLSSFPTIQTWSAGCASGEEVYSLAILLDQMGLLERSQIFGTDINPFLLKIAEAGLYAVDEIQEAEANFRAAGLQGQLIDYFEPKGGLMQISPKIAEKVTFDRHSLAQDGVFNEFQVILCRNVLIYFGADLRRKTLNLFAASLQADGTLFTGLKEGSLGGEEPKFFVPLHHDTHVYQLNEEIH